MGERHLEAWQVVAEPEENTACPRDGAAWSESARGFAAVL